MKYLDRQELLTDYKYNLGRYDFQENYTHNPEEDQTSYVEKKVFKFKYRRALDSKDDYERRNARMIEGQKKRFTDQKTLLLVQDYLANPKEHEAAYLAMLDNESLAQYKDYFRTENDEFDNVVMGLNKKKFALTFENWQIEKQDRSTFQTVPLPEWNKELGFWANALSIATEVQKVGTKMHEL
jgi:hypothetical protein